jgi:hypothetical protein
LLRRQQRLRQQQRYSAYSSYADADAGGGLVLDVIDVLLLLLLVGFILKAVQVVRSRGGLRAILDTRARQAAGAAAQRQAQQRQGPPPQPPQRPDFDRVVSALQKLPTETVATRKELEAESVAELRARLAHVHVDAAGCTEKRELVDKVLKAGGGSSGEGCAICAEEYAPGDVVRVLPWCRHRFHIECLDRWLLKSTDHSAPKGCPLCNDERWLSA